LLTGGRYSQVVVKSGLIVHSKWLQALMHVLVLHELDFNNKELEIVTLVSEQGERLDICGSYNLLNVDFYAQPPTKNSLFTDNYSQMITLSQQTLCLLKAITK
jgi:hypothetical protein